MAQPYKYVLIGGAVAGVASGTLAALTLAGGNNKTSTDAEQTTAEVQKPSPQVREAESAEVANEAGREKLYAGDASAASKLFREAVDRAPQPKYFLNLGASLFQEGKFDESLTALDAAFGAGATDELRNKSVAIAKQVLWECEHQYIACHPSAKLRVAVYPGVFTTERKDTARRLYDRGQKLWAANDQPADGVESLDRAAELIPDPKYLMSAAWAKYLGGPQWWGSALFNLEEVFSNDPTPTDAIAARELVTRVLSKCTGLKPRPSSPTECRKMSDSSRARLARAIPASARNGPAQGPEPSVK